MIYHIDMKGTKMTLMLESAFDGKEVPVTMDGKPSAETMAIKRIDSHHLSNVLKMNGKPLATSLATLSADGKTLTVVTDATSPAGGMAVGKTTEIWLLK